MNHPWRSKGGKRTIAWGYEPSEATVKYLQDMRDAINYSLQLAYRIIVRDKERRIPSPIILRRETRDWFNSRYDYARHHINPVCRAATGIIRSYRKNHHGELRIPDVQRLAMRIDTELFRIMDDKIRVTLQPNQYVWLPLNTANKHYQEYNRGRPSELLITDRKICLTFTITDDNKPIGGRFVGSDLNFSTIDSTTVIANSTPSLEDVKTTPITQITRIQNDFSRRRRQIQLHVKNPQKRERKLRETRGRQKNRINDTLHKLSTETVKANPGTSHIFENLKGIRKGGKNKGKRFRMHLNRWPYRLYQSMVEYKSPNRTLYVNPRGTSSECPVCSDKLKHPAWEISKCDTCGVDYARNKLSSLEIVQRGLRLCGQPFAVSADASWMAKKNEYLYTPAKDRGAGGTEPSNAPNKNVVHKNTHF